MAGHLGVKGNERSGMHAGKTWENGRGVDQSDILNSLKEAGHIRSSDDDCESEAMDV